MPPVQGSRLTSGSAIRENLDRSAALAEAHVRADESAVIPEHEGVFGITGAELAFIVSQAIQDVVKSLEDGLNVGEVIAVFALASQRLAAAAAGSAVGVLNTVAAVLFALASMWGYRAKRDASGKFRRQSQ